MFIVGFGHPSALLALSFFALSLILNALTFSVFGMLVGLVVLILFGQSDFIRTDP